jgi:glycosyltransferase involved in cell wall biosynthesis
MYPLAVVLTCYNKRAYLAEAVASALANDPLEIVIVDDGSLDGSELEADRLAKLDSRIKVVSQLNLGAAAARTTGMQATTAPWLVFLDGDDRLCADFAAATLRVSQTQGAQIVGGYAGMFGTRCDIWQPKRWDPYYVRYDNPLPITSLASRALLEDVGGFNSALPFAEDWDLWIRCAARRPNVSQLDRVVYEYRRTTDENLSGFVDDRWQLTAALMMFANPSLYNVEDLKFAIERFVEHGDVWSAPISKHAKRHPESNLLKFLQGLIAEGAGDLNRASALYGAVLGLEPSHYLSLLQLGKLVGRCGQKEHSYALMHEARILRPDLHFLIGQQLKTLAGVHNH